MKHSVQVTILGQQYSLKSDLPPVEVRRVADFVNEKIAEVSGGNKVVDTLNTAILALLNVAGAYLGQDGNTAEISDSEEKRLRSLADRIEKALPGQAKTGRKKV